MANTDEHFYNGNTEHDGDFGLSHPPQPRFEFDVFLNNLSTESRAFAELHRVWFLEFAWPYLEKTSVDPNQLAELMRGLEGDEEEERIYAEFARLLVLWLGDTVQLPAP